ncbi:MAG: peptidylprolyl isomerase [Planctomycetota bacterium]|nr:peptidylprolyl isomerase [Planctomycetota bacterium]
MTAPARCASLWVFATALLTPTFFFMQGCATPGTGHHAAAPGRVLVSMVTNKGEFVLELDPEHAPVSVANFLRYAQRGDYDGNIFHRVVPGFVIQSGGHSPDLTELPGDDPIINEWGNSLTNARGTIGMARDADPDSATRQWYINLADNDRLDIAREVSGNAGYAVFGRVIEGMDVVDAIAAVQTYDQPGEGDDVLKNIPVEPVILERVEPINALDR